MTGWRSRWWLWWGQAAVVFPGGGIVHLLSMVAEE